jgi:outer membrane protein TolC
MRWGRSIRWLNAVMVGAALTGCRGAQELHYLGEADLQHYRNSALQVEYPNICEETPQEVVYSQRPRTVKERAQDEIWDLSLVDAIHTAIANNKMIRTRAGQNQLLANPTNSPSVYDPALRASGFLFGNRGVEAALSDFDAQFTTTAIWGRNETVSNSSAVPGFVSTSETHAFTSQLSKTIATGGVLALNHNWNYLGSNNSGLLFPSTYSGLLQAQYTQPLWAGSGVEYTRIAGPSRQGLGGLLGVNQGVTIARINEDISVADFENAVITMTKDVEDLYWDLFLAYRQYQAELTNRENAHETWQRVMKFKAQGEKGGAQRFETQARENYFEIRARVENAQANIYIVENQLRRLIGLPVNDGRIIRPADEPLRAEYLTNWESSLSESLTKRVELRRQKWQVKSLELQRIAAINACNPQLNLVSNYQVNGFGDELLSQSTADGITPDGYHNAYGTLTRGDQTGWGLGLQFNMPIGLRAARAQVENTELQLMKARAALAAQELDISHDLAEAIQRIDVAYQVTKTQADRAVAAEQRVETLQKLWFGGVGGDEYANLFDNIIQARNSRAAAEVAFFTSLVNYNKAIVELNQRRGTLLEINSITLAEQQWTADAQDEALRRAWARSFAKPNEKLQTLPAEFSSPTPYLKTDLFPGTPIGGGAAPTPAADGVPPEAAPYEAAPQAAAEPPMIPPAAGGDADDSFGLGL